MARMSELEAERHRFNTLVAALLAQSVCATSTLAASPSNRFVCFDSTIGLVIVAGVQEQTYSDLALAYGMALRADKPLCLVLPADYTFPSVQRAALLAAGVVRIWSHQVGWGQLPGEPPVEIAIPSPAEAALTLHNDKAVPTPAAELAKATKALHLRQGSPRVFELVEWATREPLLDAAHRPNMRAWQCAGRRVLSISRSTDGLVLKGGIHGAADNSPLELKLDGGSILTGEQLHKLEGAVSDGIQRRLEGDYHKPDENWLQSVIRRDPKLVGIEQPALREVPAWRPSGGGTRWGRGYVDLVGLDGHGDIRIVETKLSANDDALLILQGLDYYIWATVYREPLVGRLSASSDARIVVHYVLGAPPGVDTAKVSRFAPAQAAALGFPWRSQLITGWYVAPTQQAGPTGRLLPVGKLPSATTN
jgi:hypothetical protein